MDEGNVLGDYLRARRERVSPADVGIGTLGRRRVSGLRREEVAVRAGVSSDYYLRLEQGRDRHPSTAVLSALARALCLDATATAYLLTLGSPELAGPVDADRPVTVPGSIAQLLRTLTLPAWVQDVHFDVVDANEPAVALSPALTPGHNRLLSMFLDPDERAMFPEWDTVVPDMVAAFRRSVAGAATGRRAAELVTRLSQADELFAQLWARHDVEDRVDRPPVRLRHPRLGELTLLRDHLTVDGPYALQLSLYHAAPGSAAAAKLAELAPLAGERRTRT